MHANCISMLCNLKRFSSVAQYCLTICAPMNHSTPGLPVHHQLPEFTQTHVHRVWCHPPISSSVVPFSSCPQSLPASESFPMTQLLAWVAYGCLLHLSAITPFSLKQSPAVHKVVLWLRLLDIFYNCTSDSKSQLIKKDPGAGKHWRQEKRSMAEDEMLDSITDSRDINLGFLNGHKLGLVGWHHRFNGHEFE